MRNVLLGYSPYHNVRAGVTYPPFLITVSTETFLISALMA